MNWTELEIEASSFGIDKLSEYLPGLGISGFVVKDPRDYEELLEGKGIRWDYLDNSLLELKEQAASVTVYLPGNEQGKEMRHRLDKLLDRLLREEGKRVGSLAVREGTVREEDWANNWKQYFKPFPVGEKLYVSPSWESKELQEGRLVVSIDPGSSFGTGQHHTTQLCMEALERCITQEDKVLDMGCGSGILLITALKLGAGNAVGVDIEENAVSVAGRNADLNDIETERLTLLCGNAVCDAKLRTDIGSGYDVVVANIVADVIISMAEFLHDVVRPGGWVITSGIISERSDAVAAVLEDNDLTILECHEQGGWVAFTAKRNAYRQDNL